MDDNVKFVLVKFHHETVEKSYFISTKSFCAIYKILTVFEEIKVPE